MKDADTMVLPRLAFAELRAEDPWGEGRLAPAPAPAAEDARWRRVAWLVPAALMAVLSLVGAAAPGLRTEELATWARATSSWPDNWALLRSGEATAAPYHLLMRAWAEAFGTSDLALRAPSMLAMTAAAALLGALAARVFTPGTGLLAGVLLALLPGSARYAQEAQPYALTLLAAVLASWLLLPAIDRPWRWRFVRYAAVVALLGLCHVTGLLLLAAHGWVVLAFRRKRALRWLAAAVAGALPAAVLLWLAAPHGVHLARHAPDLSALAATPRALFGVAALGAVLLALALFSLPLRYAAAVCTAWALVPPLVLLLIARAVPLWLPQYLLFTLPAWATLGAVALARARVGWSVAVLVAVALVGAPAQVALREPDGHGQASRQVAETVGRRLQPGDGVVYGPADAGQGARDLVARYLPASHRPRDVLGPRRPGEQQAAGCADVAGCLRGTRRVWVIRLGERADPLQAVGGPQERLLRTTYQVTQVWHPTGLTLALLVADPTKL